MKSKVVIIGAGIGGLATANILAKAGYDVEIYEKNSTPGGRAGLLSAEGFKFDTGPSWYLMPDVFRDYFSLFGKSVDQELDLIKLKPAYKVFFEDQNPLTITGDQKVDMASFEAIEPGAGQKLNRYIARGDIIYKLALRHFLYTNFTSSRDFLKVDVLRNGFKMLGLALTPIDAYVRKYVSDLRLRQILEYPMVFLGSSPFSAPAIYSLMSALDFKEGVYYPKGGLYTIIERLVSIGQELGVQYHFNSAVTSINTMNGKASGITLANDQQIKADIVVSNADLHFTETKLLPEFSRSYPEKYWQKQQAGPSALLMYLGVKGSLSHLEHHNLFFTKAWRENFDNIFKSKKLPTSASLYICKPSTSDESVAPKGHENLFVLVPLPAGLDIETGDLPVVADKYLAQIEKEFDVPDLRQRIVFQKLFGPNDFNQQFNAWQNTALGPSHILRQSAFFRTSNKSRKLKNLYYVGGSTTPGIGLPMCLIGAELVYKRIVGDKQGGRLTKIIDQSEVR